VLIGTQVLLSTFGYKMICYSLESLGILELQFTHTIERTEKTLLFLELKQKKLYSPARSLMLQRSDAVLKEAIVRKKFQN
jgi:hypothetical protein